MEVEQCEEDSDYDGINMPWEPTPLYKLLARPLRLMRGEIEHLWLCQHWMITHCRDNTNIDIDIDVADQVLAMVLLLHTHGFDPLRCMRPQWIDWITQNPVVHQRDNNNKSTLLVCINFVGRTAVIVSMVQQENRPHVLFGVDCVPPALAVPLDAVCIMVRHIGASKCTAVDIVLDFSSSILKTDIRRRLNLICLAGVTIRFFTVNMYHSSYAFRMEALCDMMCHNALQHASPLFGDDSLTTIEVMAIDLKRVMWSDSHAALSYPGYRPRDKTSDEYANPLTNSQIDTLYIRQYMLHALTVLLYPVVLRQYI